MTKEDAEDVLRYVGQMEAARDQISNAQARYQQVNDKLNGLLTRLIAPVPAPPVKESLP